MVAYSAGTLSTNASPEIVAGALSQGAYQAFTADPKAFQAKMSTRLPPVA